MTAPDPQTPEAPAGPVSNLDQPVQTSPSLPQLSVTVDSTPSKSEQNLKLLRRFIDVLSEAEETLTAGDERKIYAVICHAVSAPEVQEFANKKALGAAILSLRGTAEAAALSPEVLEESVATHIFIFFGEQWLIETGAEWRLVTPAASTPMQPDASSVPTINRTGSLAAHINIDDAVPPRAPASEEEAEVAPPAEAVMSTEFTGTPVAPPVDLS
jgi:hypothetical protein